MAIVDAIVAGGAYIARHGGNDELFLPEHPSTLMDTVVAPPRVATSPMLPPPVAYSAPTPAPHGEKATVTLDLTRQAAPSAAPSNGAGDGARVHGDGSKSVGALVGTSVGARAGRRIDAGDSTRVARRVGAATQTKKQRRNRAPALDDLDDLTWDNAMFTEYGDGDGDDGSLQDEFARRVLECTFYHKQRHIDAAFAAPSLAAVKRRPALAAEMGKVTRARCVCCDLAAATEPPLACCGKVSYCAECFRAYNIADMRGGANVAHLRCAACLRTPRLVDEGARAAESRNLRRRMSGTRGVRALIALRNYQMQDFELAIIEEFCGAGVCVYEAWRVPPPTESVGQTLKTLDAARESTSRRACACCARPFSSRVCFAATTAWYAQRDDKILVHATLAFPSNDLKRGAALLVLACLSDRQQSVLANAGVLDVCRAACVLAYGFVFARAR